MREFNEEFKNQVKKVLDENKGSALAIHGTYSFEMAYSILKEGFFFQDDGTEYDEELDNYIGQNLFLLSNTTYPINPENPLEFVLNYSYSVDDQPRGHEYAVILRVPNEKIPSTNKGPVSISITGGEHSTFDRLLDKEYVVAVIDKVNQRVITRESKELDEEFQEALQEREKIKESFITTPCYSPEDVDRLIEYMEIMQSPTATKEEKDKAASAYMEMAETINDTFDKEEKKHI